MKSEDKLHDPLVRLGRMFEVRNRIKMLIPNHPEILTIADRPYDLFKVPGFDIEDLEVTQVEVGHALATAIEEWNKEQKK